MTNPSDDAITETVQFEAPGELLRRYRELAVGGLYASLDEAIREAMRNYLRMVVDASHFELSVDLASRDKKAGVDEARSDG